MYADDTTVYASAKSISDLTFSLNKELEIIEQWVFDNKYTKDKMFSTRFKVSCMWSKVKFVDKQQFYWTSNRFIWITNYVGQETQAVGNNMAQALGLEDVSMFCHLV